MKKQSTIQKTWFVSRHDGAKNWAEDEGIRVDRIVEHLEMKLVKPGDIVIGSLPVNMVADLNDMGVRYFHLNLPLSPEMRGRSISAEEMHELGAMIEEFIVRRREKIE